MKVHKKILCWSGSMDDSAEDSSICYPSTTGRNLKGNYWGLKDLNSNWKKVTCKKCLKFKRGKK